MPHTDTADEKQPTRRELQRIETRERVFCAAIDEFNRVGVANAQIETMVKSAGVSVGTFYKNFPGKDDVLRELQRRYVVRISQAFADTAAAGELDLKQTL